MSSSATPTKLKEPSYLKVEIGDDEIKIIEKVFEIMEKDPLAFDFLEPVDYIALNILDYPKIITHPMDLGTVKKNLLDHKYSNFKEFMEDINLIWNNCRTYNLPGSEIVKMANHCEKMFNKQLDKTFKNYNKRSKINKTENEKLTANEKVKFGEIIRQQTNETLQQIVKLLLKEAPKAIDDSDSEKFKIKLDSIEYKVYEMIIKIIENNVENKEKK
jgi:hypothetical protein